MLDQRCPEAAVVAEQLKQQVATTPGAQEHLDYARVLLSTCQSPGGTGPAVEDPGAAAPEGEPF